MNHSSSAPDFVYCIMCFFLKTQIAVSHLLNPKSSYSSVVLEAQTSCIKHGLFFGACNPVFTVFFVIVKQQKYSVVQQHIMFELTSGGKRP